MVGFAAARSRFLKPLFLALPFLWLLALMGIPAPAQAETMADRREKSDWYVGFTPIGLHAATAFAPPFIAGRYLGRDWMVGVEYGMGSPNFGIAGDKEETHNFLFFSWTEKCDIAELKNGQFTNAGVFVRYIPTSTVFLGMALHQRRWSGKALVEYRANCTGGNHDATGRVEAQAIVGSAMMGNTWQFPGGFTLTGTWVVISPVVSSSSNFSLDSGQGLGPSDTKAAKDAGKKLSTGLSDASGSNGLALLSVGWSF